MGADVLAMQGARASASRMLIMWKRINSVPACQGLSDVMVYTYNKLFLTSHFLQSIYTTNNIKENLFFHPTQKIIYKISSTFLGTLI